MVCCATLIPGSGGGGSSGGNPSTYPPTTYTSKPTTTKSTTTKQSSIGTIPTIPGTFPPDEYDSVLVLKDWFFIRMNGPVEDVRKTISKGRESLVVDFNGGFDKNFHFEFGAHTTTTGACSVNFKGQFYIFGGSYIGSDIMGHQYLRQVKIIHLKM